MKYLGSKNKISKHLKPIIESYLVDKDVYIEPFVGGANMIDKINFNNKIGSDLNKYVIELLKVAQNNAELIPNEIDEEEYNKVKNNKESFEEWYVGRKEKVLLEEIVEKNGKKYFQGYTAHYVKVAVELTENDTKLEQNEVIVVDIQGFIDENLLYGKVSIEF